MTNYTFEDIKGLLLKSIREHGFESLDELYKAQQIDDIVLERDWEKVRDLECIGFDILGLWD